VANNLMLFLQTYRTFFEGLSLFCVVFFVAGLIVRILLRGIVHAWVPSAKHLPKEQQDTPLRVSLAAVNFLAWMVALVLASAVVDLPSVASFFVFLSAAVLLGPAAILFATLIAYSFSKEGNRLVSGLIGFVYLKMNGPRRRRESREFDLGNGLQGNALRVSLLQSTFKVAGGDTVTKPNAELMKMWFGLGDKMK